MISFADKQEGIQRPLLSSEDEITAAKTFPLNCLKFGTRTDSDDNYERLEMSKVHDQTKNERL